MSPIPERLGRWPRRARCRHFTLPLDGPMIRVQRGHWLEPLGTVLNACVQDPEVLAAIASGHPAPISNQGMVLAELPPGEVGLDPRRLAAWRARTGVPLAEPAMFAAPAWLPDANYVPRADVVELEAAQHGATIALDRRREVPGDTVISSHYNHHTN